MACMMPQFHLEGELDNFSPIETQCCERGHTHVRMVNFPNKRSSKVIRHTLTRALYNDLTQRKVCTTQKKLYLKMILPDLQQLLIDKAWVLVAYRDRESTVTLVK